MATPRRRELSQEEVTPVVAAAAKPQPKPKPAAGPPKPWWYWVQNEAKFRAKQIRNFNAGFERVGRVGILPLYRQTSTNQIVGPGALPSSRQATHAALVQAPTNAALATINLAQRATNGWKPADPESTPLGQGLVQVNRSLAKVLGAKLPEEMSPDDKGWFSDLPASASTGAAVTPLAAMAVPATSFGWAGGGVLSQALRWTSGIGMESFMATMLDDNTGGNISNAIDPNGPFAIKPEDDRISSAFKSLLPQASVELALGGGFLGLSKLPSVARNLREHRLVSERVNARESTVQAGFQEEVSPGQYEFRQEPQSVAQAKEQLLGDQQAPDIPSQEMAPGGAVMDGQLPDGDPAVDPWDPSLPEIDTAVIAINRLDDTRLQQLATGEGPVLPEVERQLQGQQADFQLEEGLDGRLLSAPTESLAPPVVPFADQLASAEVPHNTLMSLAHPSNSKVLHDRVVELTGRNFDEFTRADVIDGARSLEQEGLTFMPSRLQEGQQLMETGQIRVDPARFQFKEGVDAQGRQAGNSLEGVEKWDTTAEGRIQVWQDPADGNYYVVNGHNRLAKAKELGIPTLPVDMLIAKSAPQARTLGAITNIKQGMGTPFDAAKMMRELNIVDAAGLEAAGMPLKSGTAAQGLALSRLPDELFQEAVDGRMPMGRAVALGGSGLDPDQMRWVMGKTRGRDMSERGFAEFTQMVASAPQAISDQMGLFGPEMISLAFEKADLAAKVRAQLIGNKNLLNRVAKKRNAAVLQEKAGTTVDQAQAASAAEVSQALLADFDATKYAEGTPLSQMLNEGASEIANGQNAGAIANDILRKLEAAAGESLTISRAPVETNAAPAEVTAVAPLTEADRIALRNKVVQQAIDNGEVRPSATPIPELPARPMVDPGVAGRDLAENGLRPGSPAAQALMDEARLSAEYAQIDARRQFEIEKAEREAMGFDDMSLDEKKANGMLDGWEPKDTRGQNRYFHGASGEINLREGGEFEGDGMNIYGDGFYATDDLTTANKYQKKNAVKGQDGITYEVTEKKPIKFFDLDKPASEEVLDLLRQNGGYDSMRELIDTAIDEAGSGASLAQVMDEMRGYSREFNIPAYEIQDALHAFAWDLQKQGYGGFTHVGGNKAGRGKRNHQVRIYWDPANSIELKPVGAPAAPGAAAAIEIPAAASRKITVKTSDSRITSAAEGLAGWLSEPPNPPMSLDKALEIVRAKGAILDPDKIPGLDMEAARSNQAMGRAVPEVAAAYRQFYGVADELRSMRDPTIKAERKFLRLGSNQPLTPELEPRIEKFLTGVVQRISGPNAEVKFYKTYPREIVDTRWGGDGKRVAITQGTYTPISDIVRINGMMEGGLYDILSTAHHESFHRVQMGLMNTNEMKAMETAFGKARLQKLSGFRQGEIATIEQMAVAFQTYAEVKALNPGSPMEPVLYEEVINKLSSRFPQKNWRGTLTAEVATKVFTAFQKLVTLVEEFRNWTKGNGFTSVDDFFRRTYEGRIAKEREFNTALELVTQDQADRMAFIDKWMNDGPEGALSDITNRVALIDRQIADLKAKATAGGC